MIAIDAEAGARTLFDRTYKGTLPLYPTWDEQPEAFKTTLRATALAVAHAAVIENPDEPTFEPILSS